jgi:hypothetical protein
MQAEWGKGKKRAKKEGKQGRERERDSSDLKAVLITFFARRGRKLFWQRFEAKKKPKL